MLTIMQTTAGSMTALKTREEAERIADDIIDEEVTAHVVERAGGFVIELRHADNGKHILYL